MSERLGLLLHQGSDLGFLPASVARCVVPLPALSSVARTPLQMAQVGGQVIPVVTLGEATSVLVLCDVRDELIGVSGLAVAALGNYAAAEGGVVAHGRFVPELDLEGALRRLDAALEPRLGESA